MADSRKLLLTSVCKPFGAAYGDRLGTTYGVGEAQLWAQGIFRSMLPIKQLGIEFIAQNLHIPTTTLHYPSMKEFIKEVRKGYDFIGISFVGATMNKMIPMVEAARLHAPQSKIILGGYGTTYSDEELAPYADFICRSEGVEFMRNLLGEPTSQPIKQPTLGERTDVLRNKYAFGYLFGGLGCPHGCDFCATSHYFNRKHILFLPDGKSMIDAIKKLRERYHGMTTFFLHDEDFFVNKKRGLQFLEEIRKSDLPPLSIGAFSSVRALSQFTAAELVEMGFDRVWIGYEGKRAPYEKMKGRPYKELFDDFRAHGISVVASMIIGFDYQTKEIIEEEFQDLMSLNPMLCQYTIYWPFCNTPSYQRLKSENRILEEVYADKRNHLGTVLAFRHPHIEKEEMESLVRDLYRKEYETQGPSFYRLAADQLEGYMNLKDHPSPRVRSKALAYKRFAHSVLMIIRASKRYVNGNVGQQLDALEKELIEKTGKMRTAELLVSKISPLILKMAELRQRYNIAMQPRCTKHKYRM